MPKTYMWNLSDETKRLTIQPDDQKSQFHRRKDLAHERLISICRLCARTVWNAPDAEGLEEAEQIHACASPIFAKPDRRF
ncbi:hypothetical protein HNQ77_001030 [Silvibacterium bohemicum]|uniref:Uncharacterized protein n=1 Tax=Silvibacterium bohemicum TaxID=1577686 RepID=A0A841JP06_9BACT|nr:hypothetical protein [Silvibacterium bohemicum]MBB6143086.1 hypothetical protein [Silvibacterium bohemicum]